MKNKNSVSVAGLGKLGLCVAACLADKGYKVIGVDIDLDKINKINKGICPIEETGLAPLVRKSKGNLKATSDYEEAVLNSDVTFVVVATPSLADGSFSNEYLEKALHKIAEALRRKRGYHLIAVTSTVMPRTTESVGKFIVEKISGKKCGRDFGITYNPEFIALGSVIRDFLNPDFVLIGEMSKKDGDCLEAIYKRVCENNPRFARMSALNAEIAKISLNCYITNKITFANSIAAVCERVKGADAGVITQALGLDSRIGSKYIRPGLGYGGPCFPRDNVAFAAFGRMLGVNAKLAEAVDEVNRDQIARVLNNIAQISSGLKKDKSKLRVGILGLAYKPNTPVIEDSQALAIAQLLAAEGYAVSVYDPQAQANARAVLGDRVRYAKNKEECLSGADVGVVAVPWDEFRNINFRKVNRKITILDCWRVIKGAGSVNVRYLGVGA